MRTLTPTPPRSRGSTRSGPSASGSARPSRAGFALIEVSIAAVVLVTAIGSLVGTLIYGMRLSRSSEETAIAQDAARQILERMQGVSFDEIFATFNTDPEDDPEGPGSAPGGAFQAFGLNVRPGDPDGLTGRILFPTRLAPSGRLLLVEDAEDPPLGMPRDLNGDGLVDSLDHAGDYVVLPVTVRLEWTGASGDRVHDFQMLLVE